MNAKSPLSVACAAMSTDYAASDSVATLAAAFIGGDGMRAQTVDACIALCATMTGASKAGEVITHVLCTLAELGNPDKGESLAKSLYSSVRLGAKTAGHAFTVSQRSTDDGLAWIGAEVSASAGKSKAASGKRAPRAGKRERDDEAAVKALHRIREAAGLPRSMRNDDTANAIIALLATLKPATVGATARKLPAAPAVAARKRA